MSKPSELPRRPDGRPADRGPALPDGDVGPAYMMEEADDQDEVPPAAPEGDPELAGLRQLET